MASEKVYHYKAHAKCPKCGEIVEVIVILLIVTTLLTIMFNQVLIISKGYSETFEDELKPLKIVGPVFVEVGDKISFKILSEGLPVKEAKIIFAGIEKETDERGIATFQIDFAGCFKVIAKKKGYVQNSTFLWVFPRGIENFPIRCTKSASEPQPYGVTMSSFRMAGFNYARIKAYYTYDENGNIYPLIQLPELSEARVLNESLEVVSKLYLKKSVILRNFWIRVPPSVHLRKLEWLVNDVRKWGFKIFLHTQLFYVDPNTGEMMGIFDPRAPRLSPKAKRVFLEERKNEIIRLASFAERMGIEILDPISFSTLLPREEFQLYKELLPEIRKIYSGKLAISDIGINEDLSGFDYIIVLPGWAPRESDISPSEIEDAFIEYLDYAELIAKRYGLKILMIYIGHIDWIMNFYTSRKSFENFFMSKFNYSTEKARIWFVDFILNETIKRKLVAGVDVHPIWFFHMGYPIYGGEGIHEEYSYWPTKKLANLAAKYLRKPWNEEGRITLRMLQLAKHVANTLAVTSPNSYLTYWASSSFKTALTHYEKGDYESARRILQEILGFFTHIRNPLNISIDGIGDEWSYFDPVYYNPPGQNPVRFEVVFWYGKDILKKLGDVKAVYAVNDEEYLYLMIDFYGEPPDWLPPIFIDTSGEWTHERGKEFFIPLDRDIADIWEISYEGMLPTESFIPNNELSKIIGRAEIAINEVVEIRIPLKLLGNPRKVNVILWSFESPPKGDFEIKMINWTNPYLRSKIFQFLPRSQVTFGESITIEGFIYPGHPDTIVALYYESPKGTLLKNFLKV